MKQDEETHTINRLAEMTGRDRRTVKQHLRDVPPAKIEGGRKRYRWRDVEHLTKPGAERNDDDLGDKHWLHDYFCAVIAAFGALNDVFAELQKVSRRMKAADADNGLLKQLIESDANKRSEIYGKFVAELLLYGAKGDRKTSEQVLDVFIAFDNIVQGALDIDLTLSVSGFFSTQKGREFRRLALNNRADKGKKLESFFPTTGELFAAVEGADE